MKKLLALVLALVMTLGLATVSASAATTKYADKNDIDYQEAADVLTEVGVFNGKGENFAPKDNLNRGEAAKLIAYLMLGNKTAESIKGNGNKFADVPADHFAAGYIEYLATAGVVSGVGDNKFNPNGQVTAVQFAKMLCVALGYDAKVEGYVGESWNINIMKQANDDEIFKTLDVGTNDVLTREQAAQMCLNALKANMVEYESKGDTLELNGNTILLNAKKAHDKTTTATKGNAINNDDGNGTTAHPYTLQLGEDLYNGDLKMEKTHDDFGRPANRWTYKLVNVGTYVNTSDLKATYTAEIKRGPLYDLVGKSVYDNLVLAYGANNYASLEFYEDGVPYDAVNNSAWVNDSYVASENKAAVEEFIQKNGDKAINDEKSSGNGTVTQVFVDKNDNVTITVMNTYLFKASSDYRASTEDIVIAQPSGATKINLDSTRLELEDFPEIKNYKKDDYILITAYKDRGSAYTAKTSAKAELLTAKVDKYVLNDTVTLDGNVTKYSKKVDADTKTTEYSVGQETTVVLDKYGYIIWVDEAVVANNYVFISELYQNGGATTKVQANAYFTDGTNRSITIKEIAGVTDKAKLNGKTTAANVDFDGNTTGFVGTVEAGEKYVGWYTYNKNSSDEYILNKLNGSYKQEVEDFHTVGTATKLTASDTVSFITATTTPRDKTVYAFSNMADGVKGSGNELKIKGAKADDKTIFVVTYKENNDVDVYTGVKNIPEINLATDDSTTSNGIIFSVLNSSGYAKYVFVSVDGAWNVFGNESESLLYIIELDKKEVLNSDTSYWRYKALDENAEEIKVEADSASVFDTDYMAYYKTSKNKDDRYTRADEAPNSTNKESKYINLTGLSSATDKIDANNGTLTIAGDSFTLAKDYKLISVSKVDALNKKQTSHNSSYEANVVTGDGLAAMVKSWDVTYNFQAKLDGTYKTGEGGKILEAYVTFTSAVPAGTGSTSNDATAKSGVLAVKLDDALRGIGAAKELKDADGAKIYWDGKIPPTSAQIADALTLEFWKYDYLDDYYVKYTDLTGNGTYKYNVYLGVDDSYVATLKDPTADNTTKATLTSDSNWDITSSDSKDIVVVPEDVKLTVKNAAVLAVNTLIVAGKVEVTDGATINASTGAHILKGGHVDITKGGKWIGATTGKMTDNTIEGESLVTDTNTGNYVDLGNATSTGNVTIAGGAVAGTLNSYGTTTISGNTQYDATIDAKDGEIAIEEGVKLTSGSLTNSGAKVSIDEDAVVTNGSSFQATGTASNPITVGSKEITDTKAASDVEAVMEQAGGSSDKVYTATVTLTGLDKKKVTVTVSGLTTQKDAHVYTLSSDTEKAVITVKAGDEELAGVSYNLDPSNFGMLFKVNVTGNVTKNESSYTIAKNGTATVTITRTEVEVSEYAKTLN